jgi:hypothetical protein
MKTIQINYSVKSVPFKDKVENSLQWYDTIKQEMFHFKGGKLQFKYTEDEYLVEMGEEERKRRGIKTTYRLLPEVENLYKTNYKNVSKKDEIDKWFNSYLNYNSSNVSISNKTNKAVFFDVPDEEVDDFVYQADRNRFSYIIR